jgi:hypothetical protein
MRLNEFANPKEYTPTVTGVEDFVQQLLLICPDRSADEACTIRTGQRKTAPDQADETLRRAINREPRRWCSTS